MTSSGFLGGDGKMYVQVSHSDRVFKALSGSQLHRHFLGGLTVYRLFPKKHIYRYKGLGKHNKHCSYFIELTLI